MKEVKDFKVLSNVKVNKEHLLLKVQSDTKLLSILPGQFVEIRVDGSPTTFLRRPISIHDVDEENRIISFLIRIVGDGTKKLSQLQPGDLVNILYPLGNGFTVEKVDYLLIGGGCGLAPLRYLARKLNEIGMKPDILIGARDIDTLFGVEEHRALGNVFVTTEDGSVGERGYVTDHSILRHPERYGRICACGPDAMMKNVAKYAEKHEIPCEVSLENTMACGIGACLCCVTETVEGRKCVCTDGPVFDFSILKNFTTTKQNYCDN
ncbi:MAG: dihydroorotate dehydrogenase electron transfer subunit [Bacteroidales bacterium]|jgi:dihydroorotate dehydrogenase electron transfer subunit|nr:dihydroorotate dehydrogenase electron transfer subunit [Bacteroidales bacterium]